MDNTFDLPGFLLGKVYGPMQKEGKHISWSYADAVNLAYDMKRYDGVDVDPKEIYEIMIEFDEQEEKEMMIGMLEATRERMEVWNACKKCDDLKCTGCPFKDTCEQVFPYIERDVSANDYLPCDYVLTDDGRMFVVKEG